MTLTQVYNDKVSSNRFPAVAAEDTTVVADVSAPVAVAMTAMRASIHFICLLNH